MKSIIKLVIMLIFLISIFYINNIYVLCLLILINLITIIILKINIKSFFKKFFVLMPFILLTFIINLLLSEAIYSLFIVIRLFLAYMISYTFLKVTTIKEFAISIEKLISPLKIFKVNYKKVSLIIYISVSIIPYVISEIKQKKYSIKARTIKKDIRYFYLIIKSEIISLIVRVSEYEKSLLVKGYIC